MDKHKLIKSNPNRIIKQCNALVSMMFNAGRLVATAKENLQKPVIVKWGKPQSDWIILNTDGSLKQNGIAAGGGIVRNSLGEMLRGFSENYGPCSIIEAEIKTINDTGLKICE